MEPRNFKPYRCELTMNGPESVHHAVELVQRFCTDAGLAPAQRAKLSIVVEEAVTNLYDHGAVTGNFCGWLVLEGDSARIRATLADNAEPFDPRTTEAIETPDPDRGGGAGLAMIRAWADIVDYRRDNGFNLLELALRP